MSEIQELLEQLITNGWTEVEIAARLGVSQATINRWRRGERTPPLIRLVSAELRRMRRRSKKALVGGTPTRESNLLPNCDVREEALPV